MSALSDYEDALTRLLTERNGEEWPIIGYITYAITTNPEDAEYEEPHWVTPDGQRTFVTRGMVEHALDELKADSVSAFTYIVEADDDDNTAT